MYAIKRIHPTPNSTGWRVVFVRRGKKYSKTFFDSTFRGSRKALTLAVAWRDRAIAEAGVTTRRGFCETKRSNNTSGVSGVHFLRSLKQPLGVWQARDKLLDGRRVHRSFSVTKFGSAEAFRLAVASRAELLQLVDERPYLTHPTAKRLTGR